jgi:hypothetical protein
MKTFQIADCRLQIADCICSSAAILRFAFCILIFAFLGCNTLPVGYDQLRDRVTGTSDTTIVPDSSAGYMRYVPLGGASMLYLGRDTSYQSRVIVRFSLPDTLSLDSITSFQLVLHQSDTLARMSFICRPCSSEWVENGVSWQMSDSFNHWMNPGGDFLPDTVATGTMAGDSITIDFRYAGLDSAHRATIRNCGIGIFPQDTGYVAIHSGATAAQAPRLRVTYTNNGKETKRVISDIADASLIDTIATRSHPLDLLVGSGVAFRTWLRFNLDSIPAEATVARADLKLRPEMKYHRADTIVLAVHRLTESFTEKGANARFEALPIGSASYFVPADSDTVITIDIRSLVQLWTSRSDTLRNYGLLINAAPEWSPLFRLRIPRSGPNAPRLEIQYVLPPEDRFR